LIRTGRDIKPGPKSIGGGQAPLGRSTSGDFQPNARKTWKFSRAASPHLLRACGHCPRPLQVRLHRQHLRGRPHAPRRWSSIASLAESQGPFATRFSVHSSIGPSPQAVSFFGRRSESHPTSPQVLYLNSQRPPSSRRQISRLHGSGLRLGMGVAGAQRHHPRREDFFRRAQRAPEQNGYPTVSPGPAGSARICQSATGGV